MYDDALLGIDGAFANLIGFFTGIRPKFEGKDLKRINPNTIGLSNLQSKHLTFQERKDQDGKMIKFAVFDFSEKAVRGKPKLVRKIIGRTECC